MVVLQEEHLRRLVAGGEDVRLVHVALAGRAVAEVDEHGRRRASGSPRADVAVERQAHRVAGGVQRLRADHERVEVRVAACSAGSQPPCVWPRSRRDDVDRVDAADACATACSRYDGKMWSCGARGEGRADLRRLLAVARHPQRELALALQVAGLDGRSARDAPCGGRIAQRRSSVRRSSERRIALGVFVGRARAGPRGRGTGRVGVAGVVGAERHASSAHCLSRRVGQPAVRDDLCGGLEELSTDSASPIEMRMPSPGEGPADDAVCVEAPRRRSRRARRSASQTKLPWAAGTSQPWSRSAAATGRRVVRSMTATRAARMSSAFASAGDGRLLRWRGDGERDGRARAASRT